MMYWLQAQVFIEEEAKVSVCSSFKAFSMLQFPKLTYIIERANDAPIVRQLFSSSPRDPRYHMLSYISHKFSQELRPHSHEPRAALFLNRFTRTLTIVYATNGVANILGISADELNGKSFYYCIQENCLQEAVRCLESAKANDSIAYLRFWFRDPRQGDQIDNDQQIGDGHSSGDDDDGGVHLGDHMDEDRSERFIHSDSSNPQSRSSMDRDSTHPMSRDSMDTNSRSQSGNSTDMDVQSNDAVFDRPAASQSSNSSLSVSASDEGRISTVGRDFPAPFQIELEAVVSCTSDGLVVILRRARSIFPQVAQPTAQPIERPYTNGLFASPWATNPILPDRQNRPMWEQPHWSQPSQAPLHPTAAQVRTAAATGPASEDFMKSIREVAVFAWALTGINGSLAQYSRGTPTGECQPPGGLPVWKHDTIAEFESEPINRFGKNLEWEDTNGYQNRSNGHSSHGTNQSDNYNAYTAARVGSSWVHGPHQPPKPWDRACSNQHSSYRAGHYDGMR